MSAPSTGVRTSSHLRIGVAVLAVVASGLAGCGGDDEAAPPVETFAVEVPDEVDEVCEDRVADLTTMSEQRDENGEPVVLPGTTAEPAGIDLVRASARLTPEQLTITWETAGDPGTAPSPWFTLIQGTPGTLTSWGVRVDQDDDGTWRTSVLTPRPVDDPRGIITSQEETTVLDVVPTVDADGVAVVIPADAVPPAITLAWLFGATAGEGDDTVFDDCSTLFGDPGATGDTTAPAIGDTTPVPGDPTGPDAGDPSAPPGTPGG
jgi:hypothetical protein